MAGLALAQIYAFAGDYLKRTGRDTEHVPMD